MIVPLSSFISFSLSTPPPPMSKFLKALGGKHGTSSNINLCLKNDLRSGMSHEVFTARSDTGDEEKHSGVGNLS